MGSTSIVHLRAFPVMALGGALVLLAPAASAQNAQPTAAEAREARTAFNQAFSAFQALDYASALPLFQRAYVLTRNPALLYNIGTTLEHLGRGTEAATALRRYLAANPTAANRADVEAHIAQLDAASVAPVAHATSSAPPSASIVLPPDSHPRVTTAPRPAWPFVLLGVGLAAGVAGGVTLALTPDPGAGTVHVSETEYLRAMDAANTQRIAGIAVAGVGAAVAIVSVILIATHRPERVERVAWGVTPGPEGVMVTLGVRGRGL